MALRGQFIRLSSVPEQLTLLMKMSPVPLGTLELGCRVPSLHIFIQFDFFDRTEHLSVLIDYALLYVILSRQNTSVEIVIYDTN